MINIRATKATDFQTIDLIENSAYNEETISKLKELEYAEWVLSTAKICLTFEQNCDIIGIVGIGDYEDCAEVFSYLSKKFALMFNLKISRFLKVLIDNLLTGYKAGLMTIKEDSKEAKRFARFLGFHEFCKEDQMMVYIKWQA